ncbi:hypothetical protein B0H12DRAFT_359367 [Mycena haematopus]|nr:hypothetical protein B0H12DRAFT_359367 [Mycena haematopus]
MMLRPRPTGSTRCALNDAYSTPNPRPIQYSTTLTHYTALSISRSRRFAANTACCDNAALRAIHSAFGANVGYLAFRKSACTHKLKWNEHLSAIHFQLGRISGPGYDCVRWGCRFYPGALRFKCPPKTPRSQPRPKRRRCRGEHASPPRNPRISNKSAHCYLGTKPADSPHLRVLHQSKFRLRLTTFDFV